MFVLVHSEDDFLTSDNSASLFSTYGDAYEAMSARFYEVVTTNVAPVYTIDEVGDVWNEDKWVIGHLGANDAWVDSTEDKWAIIRVAE